MANKLRYMPFYVEDWLDDTQDLSPEAYRAYHRILCAMWKTKHCALPNVDTVLKNRAGVSPQKWRFVWPEIEGFFVEENGLLHSKRLTQVHTKSHSIYADRVEGIEGARKAKALKTAKTRGVDQGSNQPCHQGENKKKKDENILRPPTREGPSGAPPGVAHILSGKRFLCTQIPATSAREWVKAGLVTLEQCEAVGVL